MGNELSILNVKSHAEGELMVSENYRNKHINNEKMKHLTKQFMTLMLQMKHFSKQNPPFDHELSMLSRTCEKIRPQLYVNNHQLFSQCVQMNTGLIQNSLSDVHHLNPLSKPKNNYNIRDRLPSLPSEANLKTTTTLHGTMSQELHPISNDESSSEGETEEVNETISEEEFQF